MLIFTLKYRGSRILQWIQCIRGKKCEGRWRSSTDKERPNTFIHDSVFTPTNISTNFSSFVPEHDRTLRPLKEMSLRKVLTNRAEIRITSHWSNVTPWVYRATIQTQSMQKYKHRSNTEQQQAATYFVPRHTFIFTFAWCICALPVARSAVRCCRGCKQIAKVWTEMAHW